MVNITKKELEIDNKLKKRIELYVFFNTNCEIQKGSIRTMERTNLSYVELNE